MTVDHSVPWRQLCVAGGAAFLAVALWSPLAGSDQEKSPPKSPPSCPPFFQKLPGLGAETPRAVAERLFNGFLHADRPQILSCFDLRSARSLATAMLYAETAEFLAQAGKFAGALEKRFGQRGIDAVRGELGIELPAGRPALFTQDIKDYLSRLEIITENGTSVARLPSPFGKDEWLRLHKLEGRWYVTASSSGDLAAIMGAANLEKTAQLLKQASEALIQSKSLDQFRRKLKELQAKYNVTPALGLSDVPKPVAASEGGKAKKLPAGHFRVELTNRWNPLLGEAILQELVIETPEPAWVELILDDEGTSEKTEKRPGDTVARIRALILVDYLEGGADRFQGNYLKFALIWRESGSASYIYRKAPPGGWAQNLRLPMRRGVYSYTGNDSTGKQAVEVLAVGKHRLMLRVGLMQ